MNTRFVAICLIVLLMTPALAGRDWGTWGRSAFDSGFTRGSFGSGFFGSPFGRRSPIGIFPVHRAPRELATLFFLDRFLFQRFPADQSSRRFFSGRFHGAPWGMGPASFSSPSNYLSRHFVDEWKDRNPIAEIRPTPLPESSLLREDMQEEQVVMLLGSPIERVQLGKQEVWHYSAYSLIFEAGKLQGIR